MDCCARSAVECRIEFGDASWHAPLYEERTLLFDRASIVTRIPILAAGGFIALALGGCLGEGIVYAELRNPESGKIGHCSNMYFYEPFDIGGSKAGAKKKVDECTNELINRGYIVVKRFP